MRCVAADDAGPGSAGEDVSLEVPATEWTLRLAAKALSPAGLVEEMAWVAAEDDYDLRRPES